MFHFSRQNHRAWGFRICWTCRFGWIRIDQQWFTNGEITWNYSIVTWCYLTRFEVSTRTEVTADSLDLSFHLWPTWHYVVLHQLTISVPSTMLPVCCTSWVISSFKTEDYEQVSILEQTQTWVLEYPFLTRIPSGWHSFTWNVVVDALWTVVNQGQATAWFRSSCWNLGWSGKRIKRKDTLLQNGLRSPFVPCIAICFCFLKTARPLISCGVSKLSTKRVYTYTVE